MSEQASEEESLACSQGAALRKPFKAELLVACNCCIVRKRIDAMEQMSSGANEALSECRPFRGVGTGRQRR